MPFGFLSKRFRQEVVIIEKLVQEDNIPDFILRLDATCHVVVTSFIPADFDGKALTVVVDRGCRKLCTQHFLRRCGLDMAKREGRSGEKEQCAAKRVHAP